MICSVCGATLLKYENPTRYVCPSESKHAAILAQQRSASPRPRNPRGSDNLNKGKKKPEKKDPPKDPKKK